MTGLCGIDGCVYMAGHRIDHSWNRPLSVTSEPDDSWDDADRLYESREFGIRR